MGSDTWTETNDYDVWGNLTGISGTGGAENISLTIDTNNLPSPRLRQAGRVVDPATGCSTTPCYDDSGNLTRRSYGAGTQTYEYDAEGKMKSADTVNYIYDGFGRRAVVEYSATDKRAYFYSAGGSVLLKESFDGSSWTWTELPAYFGGEHLATLRPGSSWWKFTFRDHLGTFRVEANGNGTINAAPDFYPFGMERTSSSPLEEQLFTDQVRDSESSLDHFWFRKYQSSWGRWTSPDPLYGNIGNPQSLNRYGYVGNDPINFIDPLGLHGCDPPESGWFDPDGTHRCGPVEGGTVDPSHCLPGPNPCNGGFPDVTPISDGDGDGDGGDLFDLLNGPACAAVPGAGIKGISQTFGAVGGVVGSVATVSNFSSGEFSVFGSGGILLGWNGGASAILFNALAFNVGDSNSSLVGGSTGFSISVPVRPNVNAGGFVSVPSGGVLDPLTLYPAGPIVVGGTLSAAALPGRNAGFFATNSKELFSIPYLGFGTTNPAELLFIVLNQVCGE